MKPKETLSTLRDVLARNTRMLRARYKMSQEELADLAEMHRTYIGGIERAERNVSIDNVEKLAKAFDIEAYELLKRG